MADIIDLKGIERNVLSTLTEGRYGNLKINVQCYPPQEQVASTKRRGKMYTNKVTRRAREPLTARRVKTLSCNTVIHD